MEEKKEETANVKEEISEDEVKKALVNSMALECFKAFSYGLEHGLGMSETMSLVYEGINKFVNGVREWVKSYDKDSDQNEKKGDT